MSQENVDIFRANNAAFNRDGLDVWVKALDPFVVIRPDARWPESRPTFGRDAAHGFFENLTQTLGPGEVLIEDLIDAGDRIVSRLRIHVHGQGSDIEHETVLSAIHTFRRGKVIMIEFFLDHEEALEAAGLRE
jgi:ketosteroid isomerase-like protein